MIPDFKPFSSRIVGPPLQKTTGVLVDEGETLTRFFFPGGMFTSLLRHQPVPRSDL